MSADSQAVADRAERRSRAHYAIAGLAIVLLIALVTWKAHIISHEMIYLLGSRRVMNPALLAFDFTWSILSPTSFLFDHLVAPLWLIFDEFAIVNLGRFVTWALAAWSIVALARAVRLPAWSLVAGFAAWLLWRQTLTSCGSPFEGFQVKSFSYPLLFFSIAFAVRGKSARAGLCAGGATAFHIIVGGWGCMAIFVSMLINRKQFPLRKIAAFLLATSPFIVPTVLAAGLFNQGGLSSAERQWVDEIYVTIAAPYCADLDYFMSTQRWERVVVVFLLAPILIRLWPHRDEARVLLGFVAALIAVFVAGIVAQHLELYWFLKVLPFQLGASLPAFFMFLLLPAWVRTLGTAGHVRRGFGVVALAGVAWLLYDRQAVQLLIAAPGSAIEELRQPQWGGPPKEPDYGDARLYHWIRTSTPKESVFITPLIKDFWPYAERAQVASRRHAPWDHRLIEWTERLQAINELDLQGDLEADEGDLSIEDLVDIRDDYGATHYLTTRKRPDLSKQLLFTAHGFFVYDVLGLTTPPSTASSSSIPEGGDTDPSESD